MHLCLTIDGAAAMSSDTQICLGNGGRAEPDCGDLPRSGLADREDAELLRCRDATEIGAPFKFRRYGYAFFILSELWMQVHLKRIYLLSEI